MARANGTTVEVLARLNGLQGTALKVGQELKLPGAATAATPAASATPAAPVTPAPLPRSSWPPHPPARALRA
ncbi:LysM peptidoglycan-binding domain-containing protein [Deinococcus multiflagellatus]|uniref:LysM peptidoglycan-binding domain-containing protein n=1 Tax=Deinococcus multiflagellatus TaxID=1656887 RepID=A0ABW1ZG04_9DEIO